MEGLGDPDVGPQGIRAERHRRADGNADLCVRERTRSPAVFGAYILGLQRGRSRCQAGQHSGRGR